MNSIYERTIGLLGEEVASNLSNKVIAVIGLGGVGGTALEALARSGFTKFVIIDLDKVSPSNLNRQVLYNSKDIGEYKVNSAKKHLLEINNELSITPISVSISELTIDCLDKFHIDYIVDAIDDVKGKKAIAKYAISHNINYIMSLGMANRLDPSQVEVIRLDKTTNDPLARKLRHELKVQGIDTTKIMSVHSKETPIKDTNKLHSMMMVPSSAGLNIANYIIKQEINKN